MKFSCLLIIILVMITSWGPQVFSQEKAGITIADEVEYDALTKLYAIRQRIAGRFLSAPQYLSHEEYQRLLNSQFKKNTWRQNSSRLLNKIKIPSLHEPLFGSDSLHVKVRGEAEMSFLGRLKHNENPLFPRNQQTTFTFDLEPRMQTDVSVNLGNKLKLNVNYNTAATFNFENQLKLEYSGNEDEIIKKVEVGNVSFLLPTSLIPGAPSLFGIKTQLQFGRLQLTSIFSQQKSQVRVIQINNGAREETFSFSADQYQANQHYFLADYFWARYNEALSRAPMLKSNILISQVEVWVTNKTGYSPDARDVVALLDLGEVKPDDLQPSNRYLSSLPPAARLSNDNALNTFFEANGGSTQFARLSAARKLGVNEFSFHAQLGFISLNEALQGDEVLAVAYRYMLNGKEYQVGEFSADIPFALNEPVALFVKLLKGETLNTQLPNWQLMMKNIYAIGAGQIRPEHFKLDIFRLADGNGMEEAMITEGEKLDQETKSPLKNKRWLEVFRLDRLNQQHENKPDGVFDFQTQAYATVDQIYARLIFPVLEPFGSDLESQFYPSEQELIDKYVFNALYDNTQVVAREQFLRQNRYVIKGSYEADASADFSLNAMNVAEGSVKVFAGTMPLQEGLDFVVDYIAGRIKILNSLLLSSGQAISINIESDENAGMLQRTLFGTRLDYRLNNKLNLGGTWMSLSEKSSRTKVNLGEEPISNTLWGMDLNYNAKSRFLNQALDLTLSAEYAHLIPGHARLLNAGGRRNGTSILDDFEAARVVIDLKNPGAWHLSATPQLFAESQLIDDLAYGYNRARIAFYQIDPGFYSEQTTDLPAILLKDRHELSKHAVREVLEQEVFPFKDLTSREVQRLPTFGIAYYPGVRGPYNYSTTGFNADGSLRNPRLRWGGLFRRMDHSDFESLNIEYLEFWVMNPFLERPSAGGDLYLNLGNLSEDILKDGRKAAENGLPGSLDPTKYDETNWGRVPKLQALINVFENNPELRKAQDVGLDGLANDDERKKFAPMIAQISRQLQPDLAAVFENDPSSDDYHDYRGAAQDHVKAGILKRYELYNGTEGNSTIGGATALPDVEDVNRDHNMSQNDSYFQYKISLRPADLVLGKKFVSDEVISQVKLSNGEVQSVRWYQLRIPLNAFDQRIGGISDFKSIRFLRLFMTDFADTTVLRFAKLQLVKGDWRVFNPKNEVAQLIQSQGAFASGPDHSTLQIASLNIEENGKRNPIPYVLPPGLEREIDFQNYQGKTRLNEQSLTLSVKNLRDGYGRAAFKTAVHDFRSYKRLELYVHVEAEGNTLLNDDDLNVFLRIGSDHVDNYYEYLQPLKVTDAGTSNPEAIWPEQNRMAIDLAIFQQAKMARNAARTVEGALWPPHIPFEYHDGQNTIIVKGQPDLSNIRLYMLGVMNPSRQSISATPDDGLDKHALLWFNELSLTGFDERKGWAATARINARLADFGTLNVRGLQSTVGFGAIGSRLGERNQADEQVLDISSSLELGKFLPKSSGIRIPVYIRYAKELSTPQYDPLMPDMELKAGSREHKKEILSYARENTSHYSLNLNNVRKERVQVDQEPKIWDLENWTGSYFYSQQIHQGFSLASAIQRNYRASLAYQYAATAAVIAPFEKIIKSNTLALLRDFNFSLLPSSINFRIGLDRYYSENTLRTNDSGTSTPINTTYKKNFLMTRVYGISWNLSRSLTLDFDATNYSIIDEPEGRLNGLKRDTVWQNLRSLGRTADYNHNLNLTYQLPLHKIPGLDWVNVATRYGSNFYWQTEALATLNDPGIDLGNTIQNSRTLQLNPSLNFVRLYQHFGFGKKDAGDQASGVWPVLRHLLFSLKTVNAAYTQNRGIFMPGYLPSTRYLGMDDFSGAPGLGFVFGSQRDISQMAISKGWLTKDSLQSQLYVNTLREDFSLNSMFEPIPDLRITVIANKNRTLNASENLSYHEENQRFESLGPHSNGDYSVSFMTMKTAFKDRSGISASAVYERFMNNRQVISQRLGALNPNSTGLRDGYADGYQKSSQDVVISAFLAAYAGKDAHSSSLNSLPKIPLPNWRLNYSGLVKIPFLQENFKSIDLRHGYSSIYRVSGFNTLSAYAQSNGFVSSRDISENFLPYYQYGQVTIAEQFSPLIGIDTRLKNNLTANFEIGQSRLLGLSLANSQLVQLSEHNVVLGIGYRSAKVRLPFGLTKAPKTNNNIDMKLDVVISDHKTVVYRADVMKPDVAAGAQNMTLRPSVIYILNQRYQLKLFYDSNVTKPYTSETFNTSYSNFGFSFKVLVN